MMEFEAFTALLTNLGVSVSRTDHTATGNKTGAWILYEALPWVLKWNTMDHPDIEKIKVEGTRVIVFVPRKVLPSGAQGQRYEINEAKFVITHWARAVEPTKSVTPGKQALALDDRHGGFWAADRRGIKPVRGAPELWCYMPKIERA